jgi:hypothetical protein
MVVMMMTTMMHLALPSATYVGEEDACSIAK